jgi:hypothetical protein
MPRTRTFLPLLALLAALPAAAAPPPGWQERPALAPDITAGTPQDDSTLLCEGEGCAAKTLACTRFHMPLPPGTPAEPETLAALEPAMLGQIGFWAAHRVLRERPGLAGQDTPAAPQFPPLRLEGTGNARHATTTTRLGEAGITLAFWFREGQLYGLRCSWRGPAEPPARIGALIRQLVPGDGG